MLKCLELVGFKSFADKTTFDFAAGITAVVGPNGSGKSNLIDAVRWLLGEQSARSLRGGEMTDVIFNGSSTRKSLGLAEVTMTFENRPLSVVRGPSLSEGNDPFPEETILAVEEQRPKDQRLFAFDAEEVRITRRVYRDGEGEYLINGQHCRLKDIKDLFLGSGAGTNAYCIIEQGRVDALLQAGTRERRQIFEEAAGISRFKARKTETLRKLERVEQNLSRLQDIRGEVETQLRSVRAQAAKAKLHQEYTHRLQELRVGLGLQEYRHLSAELQTEVNALADVRARLDEAGGRATAWEAEARHLDATLARCEGALREQSERLAGVRQQIAAREATRAHERGQCEDREESLHQLRRQQAQLRLRVADLSGASAASGRELQTVRGRCDEQQLRLETLRAELAAVDARLVDLRGRAQVDRIELQERMRQASQTHNEVATLGIRLEQARREHERMRLKREQTRDVLATLEQQLEDLRRDEADAQARLTAARRAVDDLHRQRTEGEEQIAALLQARGELREQQRGLAGRVEVLEGLERSYEGLGTGARELCTLLREAAGEPDDLGGLVVGLVADLLEVPRDLAPLVDLALGEASQRFVVRDADALDAALRARSTPFAGRVSFLPLAPAVTDEPAGAGTGQRLDRLIGCVRPDLPSLPGQLLARTWLVPDLAQARPAAARAGGHRFITPQGELLEADGTLTVGTHHAEAGVLSRKSELRELREQAHTLAARIDRLEGDIAARRESLAALAAPLEEARRSADAWAGQAAELKARIDKHRDRRDGLQDEVALSHTEIDILGEQITGLETDWRQARERADQADRHARELQSRLEEGDRLVPLHEQERGLLQQRATAAEVELAQTDERLKGLQSAHRQLEADWRQRRAEADALDSQAREALDRLTEGQRILLQASADLAADYLVKETAERAVASLTDEREQTRRQRQELAERAQAQRGEWQALHERAHSHELKASELRHRREAVADPLREEYQVELAVLEAEAPASEALDLEAVQQEIGRLRHKVRQQGTVNLESLQQLAEVEQRAAEMQAQLDDLIGAQRSLTEIIDDINRESRHLFGETFAAIRTHFQDLFRKLFGGGLADLVLEDEADILESGIEIVARPPGKELRSISLMSGGEKTMTAVALLLAIFRSKPSPFCLLDEVDAALDEANTARLTAVLREFLDRSQFIIITHSKRTMAAADVLYGIAMQEPGVSRQVAVRFEDWPDEQPAEEQSAA